MPDINREMQSAQNPGPVGRNQNQKFPTHEGSQLNSPTKAGNKGMKTPHL